MPARTSSRETSSRFRWKTARSRATRASSAASSAAATVSASRSLSASCRARTFSSLAAPSLSSRVILPMIPSA